MANSFEEVVDLADTLLGKETNQQEIADVVKVLEMLDMASEGYETGMETRRNLGI